MNLAYFRKSKLSFEETVKRAKSLAEKEKLKILGEVDLPNQKGKLLNICNENWLGALLTTDKNLFGLLPCSIVVLRNDSQVIIGVSSPALLGGVTHDPAVHKISQQAEVTLKKLVDDVAGVGPLKPINVKLYATLSCPYCKMEKGWFESKNVKHDVVYVDLNPKEAEAMVAKTGQMGVPVTEIIYEDAEPEFVVGFDKGKLSSLLGIED